MRTVFFGTPELAVPILDALAARHDVAAVVCQPDRPKGRSKKPMPPPVKVWAEAHGLQVHQPEKLNDGQFAQWLQEQRPELCTVAAYGRLLKQPILDVPPLGWLNVHPSLLPRYRGPSPIQAALFAGDAETGVTIMQMNLEMDAGPIVLQERTPVGPDENAAELSARLAAAGARLLLDGIEQVARGTASPRPQDEAQVTYCQLLRKEDGHIAWTQPAQTIHNQIRACNPWPVAHTSLAGQVLRIHRSRLAPEGDTGVAGTVLAVEKECLRVATGVGALDLLEMQAPGKRVMTAAEYLRGHRVPTGMRFGEHA